MKLISKIFNNRGPINEIELFKKDIMSMSYMYDQDYSFVYQMGKVGSTALCRSFDEVGYKYSHCQWLRDETFQILDWEKRLKAKGDDYNYRLATYNHYQSLKFHLFNLRLQEVVKIITLFREPISQFLSHFFHGGASQGYIYRRYGEFSAETIIKYIHECCSLVLSHRNETLAGMAKNTQNFSQNYRFMWYLMCNPLIWFDDELLHNFNIDVYSEPFGEKGWKIINNRVMILKFETFGGELDNTIANFTQKPKFKMVWANAAKDKDYADLYNEVKSSISFPPEWLDFVYNSKYSRHFYSDSEINDFYKKWEYSVN